MTLAIYSKQKNHFILGSVKDLIHAMVKFFKSQGYMKRRNIFVFTLLRIFH